MTNRLLTATQALVALVLLAIAIAPLAAPAVSPEPAHADVASIPEEASEEGEEEEWELEEGEEEFASKGGATVLPSECVLRSAEPSVVAQLDSGTLRLTLHYTATGPAKLGITYWLKGGRGSLQLGSATHRIGRQGTLHLSSRLDEREAAKVRAAHTFIVDLDLPAAPSSCEKYLTLRLNAKNLNRSRATWSERAGS